MDRPYGFVMAGLCSRGINAALVHASAAALCLAHLLKFSLASIVMPKAHHAITLPGRDPALTQVYRMRSCSYEDSRMAYLMGVLAQPSFPGARQNSIAQISG